MNFWNNVAFTMLVIGAIIQQYNSYIDRQNIKTLKKHVDFLEKHAHNHGPVEERELSWPN